MIYKSPAHFIKEFDDVIAPAENIFLECFALCREGALSSCLLLND